MSSSTPSSPKQFSSSKLPLLNVSQCTRSEFHSFLTHSQVAEEVSLFDPSDEDPFRSECVVLQSSTSEASSFSSSIANSMSWSSSGSSTGSESRVLRHFPTNRDETPIWIALQEENENCSPGNILDFPRDSQVSPFTNHKSGDNCHVLYQERESVASIELLNALGLMNLVQGPEPVVQKKVMPASKIPRLSARYGRMYGKEHHILSLKNSRETIRQSKIPRPIKRIEPDVHRFSGHFTTSTISGYSNSMIPRPPKWFRDPSSQIQSTRFSQGHSQPKSRFSISPAIASPKTKWPKIPRFRRQCRPIVPREGLALIIPSRDDSRITPAHKASLPNLPLPMPEVSGRWSTDWDEVVDGIVKGNTDGSSSTDKQLKGKPSRINRAVVHQRRPSHTRRYLPHASSERAQRRFAGLFNFNWKLPPWPKSRPNTPPPLNHVNIPTRVLETSTRIRNPSVVPITHSSIVDVLSGSANPTTARRTRPIVRMISFASRIPRNPFLHSKIRYEASHVVSTVSNDNSRIPHINRLVEVPHYVPENHSNALDQSLIGIEESQYSIKDTRVPSQWFI